MRPRNSLSVLRVASHLSRLKERRPHLQETFGRPALVGHACSPSNRLEGVDYIDLEALRAETKPAWKGPNFG